MTWLVVTMQSLPRRIPITTATSDDDDTTF